jgi:hypothetical protein
MQQDSLSRQNDAKVRTVVSGREEVAKEAARHRVYGPPRSVQLFVTLAASVDPAPHSLVRNPDDEGYKTRHSFNETSRLDGDKIKHVTIQDELASVERDLAR